MANTYTNIIQLDSLLSRREVEVLQLISDGHDHESIAQQLQLSTKTVENHKDNIRKKCNNMKMVQIVKIAAIEGLII